MVANEPPAVGEMGFDLGGPTLWDRVEELVDRAPDSSALRAHRLHLVAARVWRSRGLTVPLSLQHAERYSTLVTTVAPVLLERVRAAYGGELMLMKGPEAAAWYRHPPDRYFRDLDLLADNAPAAQRALMQAGFVELGTPPAYDDAQHLCPLIWPGIPLVIELHRHPNHPSWLPRPSSAELLSLGVPSATGVDGLLAPMPAAHALLLVAHGWVHQPLGRLADVVDVTALLQSGEGAMAQELAREWGWDGMWRVWHAVAHAVLGDSRRAGSLNVWASHLSTVRERTVLENHIARLAAPACALPLKRVPSVVAGELWATASRQGNERWAEKLRRSRLAVVHALSAKSSHEQSLTG